jgi:hypothetical protein
MEKLFSWQIYTIVATKYYIFNNEVGDLKKKNCIGFYTMPIPRRENARAKVFF